MRLSFAITEEEVREAVTRLSAWLPAQRSLSRVS
jgi:hypothetical protein